MYKYLLSVTAVALSLGVSTTAHAEKKVLLKMPIALGSHLPSIGAAAKHISSSLGLITGGSIKVKMYEPNKLVAPFEILDAVSTGKVNAGYSTPGYWAGKMAAAPLFSAVPFGPEAGEYLAWIYHGNGRKLWQEMYDTNGFNVRVVPCGIVPPETSGWFAKPIKTTEDLKGLKMRFFGLGAKVMQKLGVSTSLIPGGEIFPALEKGAIDATEFSMPAIDKKLGFYKVAKYNYFPGWHQQATVWEMLINKDTYNAMSEGQQAAVEVTCKAAMTVAFAEGEAGQFGAMNENVNENGVHIMRWSNEMLTSFESTWEEVAVEESAKDAGFKKVYDDLKNYREGYKIWKNNAFLPRT